MKLKLLLLIIIGFTLSACTGSNTATPSQTAYQKPTAVKEAAYHKTMVKVAMSTKESSKYKKMVLDTPEKKAWFKDLMYRLWDRQITRNQFIEEGLKKYPTRHYEFNFIAYGFQRYS